MDKYKVTTEKRTRKGRSITIEGFELEFNNDGVAIIESEEPLEKLSDLMNIHGVKVSEVEDAGSDPDKDDFDLGSLGDEVDPNVIKDALNSHTINEIKAMSATAGISIPESVTRKADIVDYVVAQAIKTE